VPSTSEFERALRDAGLRVTRPRVAVLTAVHGQPHADTDSLLGAVRAELGRVCHQVRLRRPARVDRRRAGPAFEPAGSVARYETRVGDDHAHLVCRVCGAIADVDSVLGSPACRSPAGDAGFELERTEIVFWGLCPGCLSALNAGRRTDGPARPEKGPT